MTLIEIALAVILITTLFGIGLVLGAIRTPSARKEMGIRLSDDDFNWSDS